MKKKCKSNGVHDILAKLDITNDTDQVKSPKDCKPVKAGRLVIRLPLKFKLSTEQKVDLDESPSSDSDDKPLSVALSRGRKTIKSTKKKSTNDAKNTDLTGGEESTSSKNPHDNSKKTKVKKLKSDKHSKCDLKVKHSVKSTNGSSNTDMSPESVV